MNRIEFIKREFYSNYRDVWRERGNPIENVAQHPIYGGRELNCRSTLWTLTKILRPSSVLEIGSWQYRGSDMMASSMDEHNIDGYIDSFDIMVGGYSGGQHKPENPRVRPHFWRPHHTDYDKWKYTNQDIVHKDFAQYSNEEIFKLNLEYLSGIKPSCGYDMIVIDGDHSFVGVATDWEYAKLVGHSETIVVFDDLCDDRLPEVRQFWDTLQTNKYQFDLWNDDRDKPFIPMGVTSLP